MPFTGKILSWRFRHLELFSGGRPVKIFKTPNDRGQSYILSKFVKSKKSI